MCFSETASFTAAAILTGQGLLSLNLVKNHKSYYLLALVPILFAIQQFSEGILWHYFNHEWQIEGFALTAAYIFLSFAFLVWPIFIALSLWMVEKNLKRKQIIFLFVLGGIVWSFVLILTIPELKLTVTNEVNGILYDADYFSETTTIILKGIYLALLMIPIFISSLRFMWVFGVLTLTSAVVAEIFYRNTFTSVWCFFGALLSLVLYKIIQVNLAHPYLNRFR